MTLRNISCRPWALGTSLHTTASFQNINLQQAQGATKQACQVKASTAFSFPEFKQ